MILFFFETDTPCHIKDLNFYAQQLKYVEDLTDQIKSLNEQLGVDGTNIEDTKKKN